MAWFIIIGLLVIGLILLVLEIVFVPGTTIIGVLGVGFAIGGVVTSYYQFGNEVGLYVLLATLATTAVTLYFCFKSNAWRGFALKTTMTSKVNEGWTQDLKVGDEGLTISALRPSGNARFHDRNHEVRTRGAFLEPKTKVRIIAIQDNQIIVESIN